MAVTVDFLKKLKVGEAQAKDNLVIFPLLVDESVEPGYLLLDEALEQGILEVLEASREGIVNEILVRNKGDRPVLILDGEILIGAKQNRVVNASILVGPKIELKVPVSCVEQQRWRYVSEKFTESRRFSYARMRAQKNEQVADCLMSFGSFAADQGAIWDEVERKQREMRVESATRAVNDVYESHEEKLRKYCEAFHALEKQAGAAVFINGRFTCLDAFGSPASLRKLYKKMVESYALDALEVTTAAPTTRGLKVLTKPRNGVYSNSLLVFRFCPLNLQRHLSTGQTDQSAGVLPFGCNFWHAPDRHILPAGSFPGNHNVHKSGSNRVAPDKCRKGNRPERGSTRLYFPRF